jgi:hypothetical protein
VHSDVWAHDTGCVSQTHLAGDKGNSENAPQTQNASSNIRLKLEQIEALTRFRDPPSRLVKWRFLWRHASLMEWS